MNTGSCCYEYLKVKMSDDLSVLKLTGALPSCRSLPFLVSCGFETNVGTNHRSGTNHKS